MISSENGAHNDDEDDDDDNDGNWRYSLRVSDRKLYFEIENIHVIIIIPIDAFELCSLRCTNESNILVLNFQAC